MSTSRYFTPDVIAYIHNILYPEIKANDFVGLAEAVIQKRVLPYRSHKGTIEVAVEEPIGQRVENLPPPNRKKLKMVPHQLHEFKDLLNMLAVHYAH